MGKGFAVFGEPNPGALWRVCHESVAWARILLPIAVMWIGEPGS